MFQPLLGMWGIRGTGSQVGYTPKQFLLLFASMLRVFMTMTALGNSW